jgi:hypothetical protein
VSPGARAAVALQRADHWLDSPDSNAVVRRVFWLLFGMALGFLLSWAFGLAL